MEWRDKVVICGGGGKLGGGVHGWAGSFVMIDTRSKPNLA